MNETLQVYRSGSGGEVPTLVARIEIDSLTAERAIGRVLTRDSKRTIERGDHVVRGSRGERMLKALEKLPGRDMELQIDADGGAHHDGNLLPVEQLQKLLQNERPTVLVPRVDRSASSEAVNQIIDSAKASGIPLRFAMRAVDPADEAPATEAPPRESVLKLRIDRDGQTWYAGRELSLDQIEGFKQKQRPATMELDVDPNAPYEAVSGLIEILKSGDTTLQIRFASPTREPADAFRVPEPIPDESAEADPWNTPEPMEKPQQELVLSLDAEGQVLHGSKPLKPGDLSRVARETNPNRVELRILVGTSPRDIARVIELIQEAGGKETTSTFTIQVYEDPGDAFKTPDPPEKNLPDEPAAPRRRDEGEFPSAQWEKFSPRRLSSLLGREPHAPIALDGPFAQEHLLSVLSTSGGD